MRGWVLYGYQEIYWAKRNAAVALWQDMGAVTVACHDPPLWYSGVLTRMELCRDHSKCLVTILG
jgi:hypothetical protein